MLHKRSIRCFSAGLQRNLALRPNLRRCGRGERKGNSLVTRATTSEAEWATFSRCVSGEWEGSSATFDVSGKPQELPAQFVPDAYREWGMRLYDWQTQCSSLVRDGKLLVKLKRLMPTVGCEADSVAYNEEARTTELQAASGSAAPLILQSGSYSIPADFNESSRAAAEHSFVTAEGERVRVLHVFMNLAKGWRLSSVEVHKECWEAPYNGGKELAGCGGGMPSFAEKDRFALDALQGDWTVVDEASHPSDDQALPHWDGTEATCMPLGLWSTHAAMDNRLSVQAGCLLSENERIVASHVYDQGTLVCARLVLEARR